MVQSLEQYSTADFPRGSAILCRNNAPLVAFAYSLLHRDVPCRILGKDIGRQLTDLVKKMHATTIDDFLSRLRTWRDREIERCEADDRSPERIEDQYNCLCFFVQSLDESSRSVASLLAKIDLMFTDDASADSGRIVLSSIHKAKGLEYENVFILDRNGTLPSKYARQDWQLVQERNLLYVAVTRAKLNLFYIASDCWK